MIAIMDADGLRAGDWVLIDGNRGIPALKTWNAPLAGYVSPIVERGSEAMGQPSR